MLNQIKKAMMNKLVNLLVHLVHQLAAIVQKILNKVKHKWLRSKNKKQKDIKLNKNKL